MKALFGIPGIALLAAGLLLRSPERDPEVTRLQQHFREVETELLAADVSTLTDAQRAARARHIEVLREYARGGEFPHNHDFTVRTPYFRDQHGTLCAMAYLIARSGRDDLVDRVARTANNAYLPELARDAELRAWLDANGLTVAEAARIQPTYGPPPGVEPESDAGYEIATVATSVISGGAITWTLLSHPSRSNYAPGIVTTLVGLGGLLLAGGGSLSEEMGGSLSDSEEHLTTLNAVVGGITTFAGITHIVRVMNARGNRKPGNAPAQSSRWQPVIESDLRGRTQLGATLRF